LYAKYFLEKRRNLDEIVDYADMKKNLFECISDCEYKHVDLYEHQAKGAEISYVN
jgi:hypothetical protein